MKQETMSSLLIAEISGKQHNDVLKAIRKMERSWEKIAGRKFSLGYYTDPNNQKRPMFLLNKEECLYIATKFNDEARAKLVLRWEELERKNAPQLPSTYLDALKALVASEEEKQALAADNAKKQQAIEMKDAQIIELDTAVNNMKPKGVLCRQHPPVQGHNQRHTDRTRLRHVGKSLQHPAAQPEDTAQGGADMDSLRQVPRQGLRPVRDLHLHQGRRHTGRAHVHQVVTARTALSLQHPQVSQHHSINRNNQRQ